MAEASAALIVLDHVPDQDEMADHAIASLEEFPADEANATCEVAYAAPAWLPMAERDQLDAFMRDGAACILVVYMNEIAS